MPTISNRLNLLGFEQLPLEDRKRLGKMVNQAWQNSRIKKYFYLVDSVEPHGTFKVICYPSVFKETIDKIICLYAKDHKITPLPFHKRTKTPPFKKTTSKTPPRPSQKKISQPQQAPTIQSDPKKKRSRKPISGPVYSSKHYKK